MGIFFFAMFFNFRNFGYHFSDSCYENYLPSVVRSLLASVAAVFFIGNDDGDDDKKIKIILHPLSYHY